MHIGRVYRHYKPVIRLLFTTSRTFSSRARSLQLQPASITRSHTNQLGIQHQETLGLWAQPYKCRSISITAKNSMGGGSSKEGKGRKKSGKKKSEEAEQSPAAADIKSETPQDQPATEQPKESEPESVAAEKQEPVEKQEVAVEVETEEKTPEETREEMDEDYVQAVVAKASEFGDNE